MLSRILAPIKNLLALLGLVLLLALGLWIAFDVEWHRKETLTRSLSTYVSLQPANAWVITQLTNTETFEVLEHQWVLGDYPVGDTRVQVSLPATYHYYIKPEALTFSLDKRVLTLKPGSLQLLTPVGFDTRQVQEWGEKHWFGRAVESVLKELQQSVSQQLESRGRQHLGLVRRQAREALATNVHHFLGSLDQQDFYDEIVVIFPEDAAGSAQQVFRFGDNSLVSLPLGENEIVFSR